MNFPLPATILPIQEDKKQRPFWSVMIPTYRPPLNFLKQALDGLLVQALGEEMHIEVVDDCSLDVDVEAMVRSIAGSRVSFYKTPKNLGLTGCWNLCIERARGHWIHLLHQDDWVLPGFYERLSQEARLHPDISLLATRSFFVDDDGVILGVSERLEELEGGGREVKRFFYHTPLYCAGVVIKRKFYELHGGFRADLDFVLDCEMWTRAISNGGGLVVPEVLSCYRIASGTETGRLARSAETLRDIERLNDLFAERYPGFDREKAVERVCELALRQRDQFAKNGERDAAAASHAHWKRLVPVSTRLRRCALRLAGKVLE
jgi:glycosyltransferase involved in cell wall biosynthesis